MHCNGHCYLTKQLKTAEKRESKSEAGMVKEQIEFVGEFSPLKIDTFYPQFHEIGRIIFSQILALTPPVFEILQPPQVV